MTRASFLFHATAAAVALIGFQAAAKAQGILAELDNGNGTTHVNLPASIVITNQTGGDLHNVTVTFIAPGTLKVSSACVVDHLSQGDRQYNCTLGTITSGSTATIDLDVSANKAVQAKIVIDLSADELSFPSSCDLGSITITK
jgi:hypothetical protein